jgi:hypothetical protein
MIELYYLFLKFAGDCQKKQGGERERGREKEERRGRE